MMTFIGEISIILFAFSTIALGISWLANESIMLWLIVSFILLFWGIGLLILSRNRKIDSNIIFNFLFMFMFMFFAVGIPLCFNSNFSWIDAIFNSISTVTTSGLLFGNINYSTLFWLASMQWLSGLLFILFTMIAVFSGFNKSFFPYYHVQILSLNKITLFNVLKIMHLPILIYLILTLLCIFILFLNNVPLFSCIIYAMSSISTGGIIDPGYPIKDIPLFGIIVIMLFSIFGAINFTLHRKCILLIKNWFSNRDRFNQRFINYSSDDEILWGIYLLLSVLSIIFISKGFMNFSLIFNLISAITTSGFIYDIMPKDDLIIFLVLLLIFIGGSSFSSSSGLKLVRLRSLILCSLSDIKKSNLLYYAKENITCNNNIIDFNAIISSWIFFTSILLVYVFFLCIFSIFTSNLQFIDLFVLTSTSIFNVGNMLSVLGVDINIFDTNIKLVYAIAMIIGRFEVLYLIMLFIPYNSNNIINK